MAARRRRLGLWARASSDRRALTTGVDSADSWAVDAHKWLNVPYDCGCVIVRNPQQHLGVTRKGGTYAMSGNAGRDGYQWVPEFSRRARAIPVYAVIRALGKHGVDDLVTRCCALARRFADKLAAHPGIEIVNDVVLNQVLIAFPTVEGNERFHRELIVRAVHKDGTFWAGTTEWDDRLCMRISVSGWSTTAKDIDLAAERLARIVDSATVQRQGDLTRSWL